MRFLVTVLAATLAVAVPTAAKGPRPATIPLPNGFQPEGIAIGKGNSFFVGSIPTGAVYAGDLRTGTGSILVAGAAGRAATGLKYDRGRLFVSGAGTGKAFVYDARSGALIREYQLAQGSEPTFVNDVVVTRNAAYFTDSNRPVIYRIALGPGGEPAAAADTVPLTGDYQHVANGFNLNGIDASRNARTLLAVQSATGKLFAIDPGSGATRAVDLGGVALTNGDGILLRGERLYVVQNRDNKIAVVKLRDGLSRGTVERYLTDPGFDVPTTIAAKGDRLYAVNARFTTPPSPSTTYTVVGVKR